MKNLRRGNSLNVSRKVGGWEGEDGKGYVCHVVAEPISVTSRPDTRNLHCLNFPGVNSYFGGAQGGLVGLAKQLFLQLMKTKTYDVFCNMHTLDPNLRYPINYKLLQ